MPTDPEHAPANVSDYGETAVPDAVSGAPTPASYGDRFAEDAFDYPLLPDGQNWSAEAASASAAVDGATADAPQPAAAPRGRERGQVRGAGGWQQVAVFRSPALAAGAAVLLLGGFGFALSTVSDTVSSDPTPGSTVQVSAPKSPTGQPLPPAPTAGPGADAGVGAAATPTSTVPGTGEDRRRAGEHGPDEQEREDGDHTDD
ncbi:hypothetical protein FNH09_27055 [Streptomyces adustus]|uniref:Uncharacterized protein n=1 Tax=Streptomyces adustus TaxID=1609272 RepID=A0A5N8VHW4_9ACTN|nr:hypothetical protein [Streptomyces adustus]MPY34763.1 hypothetical protein [Streptomyces adustus]